MNNYYNLDSNKKMNIIYNDILKRINIEVKNNTVNIIRIEESVKIKKIYKNKIEDGILFKKSGDMLAIFTILNISEVLFKGVYIEKNFLKVNFSKTKFKINKNYNEDMLNFLHYNSTKNKSEKCKEYIDFLFNNWCKYGKIFIGRYCIVYNHVNEHKDKYAGIIEMSLLNNTIKHNLIEKLYRLNENDLQNRCSIIESKFNCNKLKGFTKLKQLDNSKKNVMDELEFISDEILKESVISINNNVIVRQWIGFEINNDNIVYKLLSFDYDNGVIGIGYFYMKLFMVMGKKYYSNVIKEILNGYLKEKDNEDKELNLIANCMYKLSKDNYYKQFIQVTLEDNQVVEKQKMLDVRIKKVILKNEYGKYVLGVNGGLAGYGVYLINKHFRVD